MKFRKKPVVIEAVQWHEVGDHPAVRETPLASLAGSKCRECGGDPALHGYVKTLEGGHIVCPGDWIITGVAGELYPCKDTIFKMTYELVDDSERS